MSNFTSTSRMTPWTLRIMKNFTHHIFLESIAILLLFLPIQSLLAEQSAHISPDDLFDRIIESAKADTYQILASSLKQYFENKEKNPLCKLFPDTTEFIEDFAEHPKYATFTHIRLSIKNDFFDLPQKIIDLSTEDIKNMENKYGIFFLNIRNSEILWDVPIIVESIMMITNKRADKLIYAIAEDKTANDPISGDKKLKFEVDKIIKEIDDKHLLFSDKADAGKAKICIYDPLDQIIRSIPMRMAFGIKDKDFRKTMTASEKIAAYEEILIAVKGSVIHDLGNAKCPADGNSNRFKKQLDVIKSLASHSFNGGIALLRKDYIELTSQIYLIVKTLHDNNTPMLLTSGIISDDDILKKIVPQIFLETTNNPNNHDSALDAHLDNFKRQFDDYNNKKPKKEVNGSSDYDKIFSRLFDLFTTLGLIAMSDTNESGKNILDQLVAPPGTFRELRSDRSNIHATINSYFGGIYGKEYIHNSGLPSSNYFAPFVPVGLEISNSWASSKSECSRVISGIGLLLAPIDLGTIVTHRTSNKLNQNSTSWQDVYAPGAFIIFKCTRDYPIAFGVGIQWCPNLISDPAFGNKRDAIHVGAFMAWDVPLFTF